jgi:hypothetical protein
VLLLSISARIEAALGTDGALVNVVTVPPVIVRLAWLQMSLGVTDAGALVRLVTVASVPFGARRLETVASRFESLVELESISWRI